MLCFLLAGCAVGPDYVRPPTPAPAGWRVEYEAAAGMADLRWWQQFGDPVLDSLVADAVRNNLDLKAAVARIDQRLGLLQTTRSQYFPEISGALEPGAQNSHLSTSEIYSASLSTTWEIDLWGRIRRLNEAEQARVMASEAGHRATILKVVTDVATDYLTLRGYDRQLEIARESEQAYAEGLRVMRLRFEYGDIDKRELAQQEDLYESARQTIPQKEALIRQTENAICLLLGRPPGPVPRGTFLDGLIPPGIPAGLPSQLLERRPDIIQAEQELIAANAAIGAARADYFPKLTLTGALGVASGDIGQLLAAGSRTWNAAGALAGPILDFGRTAGKVKQAEAVKDEALYTYRQAILKGFSDVEDALIKTTKKREELNSLQRQLLAQEAVARLSKLQYDAGAVDFLNVQSADTNLLNTRLNSAQARSDLLVDVVSVYKAMGGGWVTEADKLGEEAQQ